MTQEETIGKIITNAMNKHELNHIIVDRELKLHGHLIDLMNDDCYTNTVPVVLFKNLLVSLYIPFETIEAAMLPTFKLVQSKKDSPANRKKIAVGYIKISNRLWANEESLMKYTSKLKEIMPKVLQTNNS